MIAARGALVQSEPPSTLPGMLRGAPLALLVLALAACGGTSGTRVVTVTAPATTLTAPTATTPAPATTLAVPSGPTLEALADREACNELQTNIRIASQLVATSAQEITHSLHPKQLARHTGDTRRNLLFAANVLSSIEAPASLVPAKKQLVAGLRRFAADFGRAQRSVAAGSIAKAAQQLVDRPALAQVTTATQTIEHACGG
jgi:hypothetical protein